MKQFLDAYNVINQSATFLDGSEKIRALHEKLMETTEGQKSKPTLREQQIILEFFEDRQYEKAEELAILMTQDVPNHPFGWKALGQVFSKKGKKKKRLNSIGRLLN